MPLLSVISSSAITNFQFAKITSAEFQTVSTRGQVTITNITGNFKSYNVINNGVIIASNQTASSYTITGLSDNVQIGPITIIPNNYNSQGSSYTVTGGSGSGKIYTLAFANTPTFSSTQVYSSYLICTGSFYNCYVTYTGSSATPISGSYLGSSNSLNRKYTTMASNTTYIFSVYPVNNDGIISPNSVTGTIKTAYYSATGTYSTTTFSIYNLIKFTSGGSITFYNQNVMLNMLLVAGGGAGGSNINFNQGAGGGGGGGVGSGQILFVNGVSYSITIGGGGGTIKNGRGGTGGASRILAPNVSETANGGGGGGGCNNITATLCAASGGGSGGGAGYASPYTFVGGASATRGTSATTSGYGGLIYYGNNGGGNGYPILSGGGGGGAGGVGGTGTFSGGGGGGGGYTWILNGSPYSTYGGGGGGSGAGTPGGSGGNGGGGNGTNGGTNGGSGAANTGGGGGGVNYSAYSGSGGTGICIIAFE